MAFIGRNTYASLVTFVEDSGTGEQLSEWSPAFWKKYNESRCEKLGALLHNIYSHHSFDVCVYCVCMRVCMCVCVLEYMNQF